jgi:hypothetical protein
MAKKHEVQPGESLAQIAAKYSFGNWKTIYEHPENAAVRKKRGAANQILAGDVLFIPDQAPSVSAAQTDSEQTLVIGTSRGVWKLVCNPDKRVCGEKTTLRAETNLTDPLVRLKLFPRQDVDAKPVGLSLKINGQQLVATEWEVHDIPLLKPPNTTYPVIELTATTESEEVPCNVAVIAIQPLSDAKQEAYAHTHSWSGYSVDSHFKQQIEKFCCRVELNLSILKAWGAYRVNLSSLGFTGKAGGCPWAGYRWARAIGGNAMAPDEYYDGKNWQPIPSGFTRGTNESAVAFYQSGQQFLEVQTSAPWPESFAAYDFNATEYATKRAQWETKTHDVWTDQHHIRRRDCHSAAGTRCCIYAVDVSLKLTEVGAPGAHVVAVCPGGMRSNASIWFMGDSRVEVAAHESGHLIGLPDEYSGGAVDTTLNDDGAKDGIDLDSIMGSNLSKVKRRHYRTIVEMTKRLIKSAYGRDYEYDAVDKKP